MQSELGWLYLKKYVLYAIIYYYIGSTSLCRGDNILVCCVELYAYRRKDKKGGKIWVDFLLQFKLRIILTDRVL